MAAPALQRFRKKLSLRHVVGAVAIVIVVLSGIIAAAVLFVRSESGSRWLLAFVKAKVERSYDARVTFDEGRLDPFSSLSLTNLKVRREPPQEMDIAVSRVELDYVFSVLKRSITVRRVLVERPSLRAKIFAPTESAGDRAAEPVQSNASLGGLLRAPPAAVEVQSLIVRGLDCDLEISSGDTKAKARIQGMDVETKLAMKSGRLESEGTLKMSGPMAFKAADEGPQGFQGSGLFSGEAGWGARVVFEEGRWNYEIKPTRVRAHLRDFKFSQRFAGAASRSIELGRLDIENDLSLLAHSRELFSFGKGTKVERDAIKSSLTAGPLLAVQKDAGGTTRVSVPSQKLEFESSLGDAVLVKSRYLAHSADVGGVFARPADAELVFEARLPLDLASAELTATADFNQSRFMNVKGRGELAEKQKSFDGEVGLRLSPEHARVLKALRTLTAPGAALIDSTLKLTVEEREKGSRNIRLLIAKLDAEHRAYGAFRLKGELDVETGGETAPSFLRLKGNGDVSVLKAPEKPALPLSLDAPVAFRHHVELGVPSETAALELSAPLLSMSRLASVRDTKLKVEARSPRLREAKSVDVTLSLDEGAVEFDGIQSPIPVTGLKVDVRASLRDSGAVALEEMRASLNGGAFRLNARGAGNLNSRDLQMQLNLLSSIAEPMAFGRQKISGQIEVPASLTVDAGKEISLRGRVSLQNLAISSPTYSASGISGSMLFSEQLTWSGEHARFRHLITQNPFERVDFDRVRPLLQSSEPLRIAKLTWEERAYGPFIGFFSVAQNMLSIHQFDLDLGSGRVYGEMFLDAYPSSMRFGLLSRMSGVNLSEVLPHRFLAKMREGDKNVSMRSGFVLNFNRNLLDGRVDVTEIGGPQLVAFINVLDPDYRDEKLNKVRSLLGVGYPTGVELAFREGYMNMDVDMSLLGIRQRQSLREIPISTLLAGVTADFVAQTRKGPLK